MEERFLNTDSTRSPFKTQSPLVRLNDDIQRWTSYSYSWQAQLLEHSSTTARETGNAIKSSHEEYVEEHSLEMLLECWLLL